MSWRNYSWRLCLYDLLHGCVPWPFSLRWGSHLAPGVWWEWLGWNLPLVEIHTLYPRVQKIRKYCVNFDNYKQVSITIAIYKSISNLFWYKGPEKLFDLKFSQLASLAWIAQFTPSNPSSETTRVVSDQHKHRPWSWQISVPVPS